MNRRKIYYTDKYDGEELKVHMTIIFSRIGFWKVETKSGVVLKDMGSPSRFLDTLAMTGTILHFALDKKGEAELGMFWKVAHKHMGKGSEGPLSFLK